MVAFEMPENPIEHSRSLVMEPLDDGHDVVDDRWGRRFSDVLDDLSNLSGIGAVPIGFQQPDEPSPLVLLEASDRVRPHLFPLFGWHTILDHISRSQRAEVQVDITSKEPLILRGQFPIRVEDHLVLKSGDIR